MFPTKFCPPLLADKIWPPKAIKEINPFPPAK